MNPTGQNAERLAVRWITRDQEAIAAIRERYGIPAYTTVNGWSPAEIAPEDMREFEECAKIGFFSIIHAEWYENGGHYVFKTRK